MVLDGAATSLGSDLVTNNETETTSEIAAMMAVTPTTHGHFGGERSAGGSAPWS